ncbi:MAG: hypothetical protein LBH59_02095 [Planctomycetaceae bacterium]|nr:hypothetical protein [Planctomycetaceae bacterium]
MHKIIPKPVWAVGFALEQTLRDATLAVFSFLILKRVQHKYQVNRKTTFLTRNGGIVIISKKSVNSNFQNQ